VAYLLDANIFIQAKNLHYGLDFCPAFWEWLIVNNNAKLVYSIEKVGDEINAGADELAIWAKQRGPEFFLKPETSILPSLGTVSAWAAGQKYESAAVNTFLQLADYYLVAYAHAKSYVVVTNEITSISTKRIKIPNVCIGLGIKCMTPYDMLRHERARFILGPQGSPK
jgi:hypothetical protein